MLFSISFHEINQFQIVLTRNNFALRLDMENAWLKVKFIVHSLGRDEHQLLAVPVSPTSLVVVENLWDKSTQSHIFSLSESVPPQVPKKKSLHELLLAKILEPFERGVFPL